MRGQPNWCCSHFRERGNKPRKWWSRLRANGSSIGASSSDGELVESNLPVGSEIRFRDPNLWDQYRLPILGILAAVLVQSALMAWLIYEHRRRSLAEVQSRNALAELANMNRLATAGQLSGSIAHEINQPVTGIVLKASAALRWLAVEKPDMDKIRSVF